MGDTVTCRRCGKEIFFIRTKSGKNMPLDVRPVICWPTEHGRGVVYTAGGERLTCEFDGPPETMRYEYRPHWATCPFSDELRRGNAAKKRESETMRRLREAREKQEAAHSAKAAKAEEKRRVEEARKQAKRDQYTIEGMGFYDIYRL